MQNKHFSNKLLKRIAQKFSDKGRASGLNMDQNLAIFVVPKRIGDQINDLDINSFSMCN